MTTTTTSPNVGAIGKLRDDLTSMLATFTQTVSSKFGLPLEKVQSLWAIPSAAPAVVTTTTTRRAPADPNGPKCSYMYQRGKNAGSPCGDPVCADSTSYCRKHAKHDGAAPKSSKAGVLAAAKELANGATAKPVARASQQLHISSNAYGNYEHKPTGLVFNKEKKVFGRQVGDKVLELTATDVANCTRNGFAYLPEAVAKPEEDKPTSDEVEVPDDTEVANGEEEDGEEEIVVEEEVEEELEEDEVADE